MNKLLITLIFPILLTIIGCNEYPEGGNTNSNYQEAFPPVSDSAPIPEINAEIGIETGDIRIIWTKCNNAINYELQKTNVGGGWETAYFGNDFIYDIGARPVGISISFRVRAFYSEVVSRWSKVITI